MYLSSVFLNGINTARIYEQSPQLQGLKNLQRKKKDLQNILETVRGINVFLTDAKYFPDYKLSAFVKYRLSSYKQDAESVW